MERPRPSSLMIGALVASVSAYEYFCPSGELLSERADEWMEHPIKKRLLQAGVGAVALHLINAIDPNVDVFHYLSKLRRNPMSNG